MDKIKTKDYILNILQKKRELRTGEIVKALGLSRQTVAQHLQELVTQKKLSRLGSTIDSRYVAYIHPSKRKTSQAPSVSFIRNLNGLEEDRVFDEIDLRFNLKQNLSQASYKICRYAFTEMLNNAIDHSQSKTATIHFELHDGNVEFYIYDRGVGAFESIRKTYHFQDHYEALEHLMKGKQTADPERHSGQGIFFTSRAADLFILESAELKWQVDNRIEDATIEELKSRRLGTFVFFSVRMKSKKDLKKIFDAYTDDTPDFDKTVFQVKLVKKDGEYVSRSEAKRILIGLDKFKRIVLDFKDVESIGQAFADEVFRVFAKQYPTIQTEAINTNSAVRFMIDRAITQKPVNRQK